MSSAGSERSQECLCHMAVSEVRLQQELIVGQYEFCLLCHDQKIQTDPLHKSCAPSLHTGKWCSILCALARFKGDLD